MDGETREGRGRPEGKVAGGASKGLGVLISNGPYIETLYERWKDDPDSLSPHWQVFFQGFELSMCPRTCTAAEQARKQSAVASLIFAYRSQGHSVARLDPLGNNPTDHPDVELDRFGLVTADLDRVFDTGHLAGPKRLPLRDILAILQDTYCGNIGVEYLHIQDVRVRRWLQAQMEPVRNQPTFSPERKMEVLRLLVDAEVFETFTHSRYLGQKRFSLEGGESLIPALHALVELAPELGVEEIVLGMTHRGRLNVMANILDLSYATIFSEFEGNFIPESVGGDGDVKYHRGFSSDHVNHDGRRVHISLTANPSHLEAVDPVVEGRTRGKQRLRGDTESRTRVVPLIVHGDAAFAGQGLVAETLNLSQLEGYRTGGTVHVIVNNQIGFTTLPRDARSTVYSTDVAKMIDAPIFHVNGDDPEAVCYVTELALRYRQTFGRDVVVDMICYRRHGHNETDEPAFTQPVLYRKIREHPSVRRLYTERLVESGELADEAVERIEREFQTRLEEAHAFVKEKNPDVEVHAFETLWEGYDAPYRHDPVVSGVDARVLMEVGRALTTVPEGFALNPKVRKRLPDLMKSLEDLGHVDWSFAELLAFGTLLCEGVPVRLSGQDSMRGTFSQRHAVWHDMKIQEPYIPLNRIRPEQARFCVYNSALSEAAVLGFEYGYSLTDPRLLVIWEAQFGDFSNGAQVIIDQFIVSSQSKWQRTSGLVMLLPHGYEGQGPEHSNAYLERYLAACSEENIQVCYATTPAQVFHLLRRQVLRDFRRPLVLMAPKSMLRHPRAVSPVADLLSGGFHEILDDPAPPGKPKRLVLCSGKVFYDLADFRERERCEDTALVRIEQLYPLKRSALTGVRERYASVQEVVWAQEESKNRGGWTYMFPILLDSFPDTAIRYVGRPATASPATGSLRIHKAEQEQLVRAVFSWDVGLGLDFVECAKSFKGASRLAPSGPGRTVGPVAGEEHAGPQ